MSIGNLLGGMKLSMKNHSPELFMIAGTGAMVCSIVSAFKARPRYEEIMEEHKKNEEMRKKALEAADSREDGEEIYTPQQRTGDAIANKVKTGMKVAVCFAKTIAWAGLAFACFNKAARIYRGWFVGAAAAAESASKKLYMFEAAAMSEVGKEKLQDIKDKMVVDETEAHAKEVEDPECAMPIDGVNGMVKWFDELNPNWRDDPEANRTFLRGVQEGLNVRLQSQGYLLANDVWRELQMPVTEYGQIYGILAKNPDGTTNCLDFGIMDGHDPAARWFVNGYEANFLIKPNFDPVPIIGRGILARV